MFPARHVGAGLPARHARVAHGPGPETNPHLLHDVRHHRHGSQSGNRLLQRPSRCQGGHLHQGKRQLSLQ